MSEKLEPPLVDPARWQLLNEIFAAALELGPEQQHRLLEQRCAGDQALQNEASALLAATRVADRQGFLGADVFADGVSVVANDEITPGTIIGGYRIVREIGRGGMGAVYLALREGFHQEVALKIIKRGMDTDQIIRRFLQERDVLASLNHPNIARLLDGGHTTDGLPFIAMEYVEGQTITEFCDQKRLSIDDRIVLFRKVCKAVAYAHHNLVVHRDIKPSNLLVTPDGEPKLLDFGIAKLLSPAASGNTIELTVVGANLMTPDYASPEQIRGERVTTVSDIYSLGVLLYELLCGRRPFRLRDRPSAEILKIVSEQEPSAPSTAALTKAEPVPEGYTKRNLSPETLAASRNEQPARLRKRLRGDLDNIVLTALRKDPQRRYSSVEQFSEDLQRHLSGLPVLARPSTLGYQVGKFVQRNRSAVAFATLALVALLAGLSIAVWQAVVARQERARAEQRFEEVRKLANTLVSGWDKDIPASLVSNQVRGRIADISIQYLDNLAQETNDPTLLKELGRAYVSVGHEYSYQFIHEEKARSSLGKAEAIARRLITNAPDDVEAKRLLAETLEQYDGSFGERDRTDSLRRRLEIVKLHEGIIAANADDLQTSFDLANSYARYGLVLKRVGRFEEAQEFYREATETRKRRIEKLEKTATTTEDQIKLSNAYSYLAGDQANHLKEYQAAAENFRRALQIAERVFEKDPENNSAVSAATTSAFGLGLVMKHFGDFSGALETFRKSLRFARLAIGRSPSGYYVRKEYDSLMEIAETLHELGQPNEAVEALRESVELRRKFTEREKENLRAHVGNAYFLYGGAKLLTRMNRMDEARAALLEAEQSHLKVLAGDPNHIANRRDLATLYLTLGDFGSGLGVCSFQRAIDYDAINESYRYCPPELKARAGRGLNPQSRTYYQKAADILAKLKAENRFEHNDFKTLDLAQEKLRFSGGS